MIWLWQSLAVQKIDPLQLHFIDTRLWEVVITQWVDGQDVLSILLKREGRRAGRAASCIVQSSACSLRKRSNFGYSHVSLHKIVAPPPLIHTVWLAEECVDPNPAYGSICT